MCFFQGGPSRQLKMTNSIQDETDIPLLVAIDAEWGLGMRLDSTISFPFQMTIGAIENDSLVYHMGCEIANQLKQIGVHINFAPVADINSNPDNPVIGMRSFGENKQEVFRKSLMYVNGLQDNDIMATAKTFSGAWKY